MFVANECLQRPLLFTDVDDSTSQKVDFVYSIVSGDEGVCVWRAGVGCNVLPGFVFFPCALSHSETKSFPILIKEEVSSRSPVPIHGR